jgi:hypothetical protein
MDDTDDHGEPRSGVPMPAPVTTAVVNPYLKTTKSKDNWKHTPMTGFLLSSVIQPKQTVAGDTLKPATVSIESVDIHDGPQQLETSSELETKGTAALPTEPPSLLLGLETKSTQNVAVGENLAIQYRLPSRTVSFQSAEHLSVLELHSHRQYYQDRSVRFSGIILHRHVMERDASICFVVGDAVEAARPPAQTVRPTWNPTPNTPQPQPQGVPTAQQTIATTPHSAKRDIKTLGVAKTPLSRSKLHDKTPHSTASGKRKLIHVPKSAGTNRLLSRSSKRRLSFSTPTESALRCLLSQPTVLVIVNPLYHPQAADCGVGDSLMVIGEVVLHTFNNPLAEPFLSQYRKKLERLSDDDDTEDKEPNHHHGGVTTTTGSSSSSSTPIHYVAPRILRNINGTNLRLQYEALWKRREHVLLLSNDPNQPGRGPPQHELPHTTTLTLSQSVLGASQQETFIYNTS